MAALSAAVAIAPPAAAPAVTPPDAALRHLHDLPLPELLEEWDRLDECGRNLAAIRALALCDRFYLAVKVLGRKDMLHPWVYARCREVEADPDSRLDLWSREHFKSSIITYAGVIQEILRDPEITIAIFSYNRPAAKKHFRPIKETLELNQALKAVFPDILWANPNSEAPRWSEDGGIVVKRKGNPKESTLEAWGLVDGQPTGSHFQMRVYDDVVTKESVTTAEQNTKTIEAFQLSDNLGVVGGRVQVIGTRYNYADAYENMLKRGTVRPRIYAATHNGQPDGEPVYLEPAEWARRKRDQSEALIASQYLQNPLAGLQKMFNVEDYRVYEVRPETLNVYLLVDPARSKKKDSDKTAMALVGIDYAGNKYLLDGYNHKMDLQERWNAMKNLYTAWVYQPGIISLKVGYEGYAAEADLEYFRERMTMERVSIPIDELKWPREGDGSKIDRVQRLGPDLRNHRVYLPYDPKVANPEYPSALTSLQRQTRDNGFGYRIAAPIKRRDTEGKMYDLAEDLRVQTHYFPFGSHKDLIDALSRLYDMEPTAPVVFETGVLEPAFS